jgi:hypothetical protein
MDTDKFQLVYEFQVSSDRLFRAWLNSDEHAAFTGGDASIVNEVGSPGMVTSMEKILNSSQANVSCKHGERLIFQIILNTHFWNYYSKTQPMDAS